MPKASKADNKQDPKIVVAKRGRPKSADELLSVRQIAGRVRRDPRAIRMLLDGAGVQPDSVAGGTMRYRMSVVQPLLDAAKSKLEDASGSVALKDQKLMEEIRKLRIANDAKGRKLVDRAVIEGELLKVATEQRNILRLKLENEWPAKVAGLDVTQARVYGRRLSDEIMLAFQSLHTLFSV